MERKEKRQIRTEIDNGSEKPVIRDIRPTTLREYIGQERIKEELSIYIAAAKERREPLDHMLLSGPPGLGKTTLAGVMATEMGTSIRITSGPAIEKPGELAALLNRLSDRDILFIDEIHRLDRHTEEYLYPAMEDFELDIMLGKGAQARSVRLGLPKFTLIGATTRPGMLTAPLRDRFGISLKLDFYEDAELKAVIERAAGIIGMETEPDGAMEMARRSRGTPRIANRLLRRVRDYAQAEGSGCITKAIAEKALSAMDIDPMGLDATDRRYLKTLLVNFGGGPAGLETLAAALAEDPGTLESVCEPFLLKKGLINRTSKGRTASRDAYAHLGIPCPQQEYEQLSLFGTSA